MNLSTDTIISNNYAVLNIRSVNTVSSYYKKSDPNFFIIPELNKEIPLYLVNLNELLKYNYSTKLRELREKAIPRVYLDYPIKVLGEKFYTLFKSSMRLRSYTASDKKYFIGKGIITDSILNPLILTTYKLTELDLDIANNPFGELFQDNIKIYINRSIYSENFKINNKRLHKELFQVILPALMLLDVPIIIKRDLNIFVSPYVDPKLSHTELQEKFKIEGIDAKNSLIRELQ